MERGGQEEGLGSQTKPSEHPQIKRDTHFSRCRPSKRIHLDHKWLSVGGEAQPHKGQRLKTFYAFAWTVCVLLLRDLAQMCIKEGSLYLSR